MKSHFSFLLISLCLLGSCGKKATNHLSKSIQNGINESLKCTAGGFNRIGSEMAADHDIKLYRETVDLVLNEIRDLREIIPETFWTTLSKRTRDQLSFELNIMMLKTKFPNPHAVYRSTAYFFVYFKNNFKEGTDYKLKDTSKGIYSFTVRGHQTVDTHLINFPCDKFLVTDLRSIPISPEIYHVNEINDAFECRTEDRQLFLMEVRDRIFVSDKTDLYSSGTQKFIKKENRRKISMRLDSSDIKLDLVIKRKREAQINGIQGNKAIIDLRLPTNTISGKASCDSMKRDLDP